MPPFAPLASAAAKPTVGDLLRDWRRRRGLAQLDLAAEAGVSQRHLSFIESGRAGASREMLLRLADHLDMPLRARNALLDAGGFAPVFAEIGLADPALAHIRSALESVMQAHLPNPALIVDRHWTLQAANDAVFRLIGDVAPRLLVPPVNVLRLSLDPEGLAPRLLNRAEWHAHVLERLRRQARATGDPDILRLMAELPKPPVLATPLRANPLIVPFRLATPAGELAFFTTTTVLATAVEVTLSELMLEAFYPADPATAAALRRLTPAGAD